MAAGAYTKLPKLATGIDWLSVTSTPLSLRVPATGSEVMMMALRVLAGESDASAKPKSAAAKVLLPSSSTVIVLLAAVGASLTGVTLMVMVLAVVLVSTPPLAVPPLSCTLKPKVA